MTDIDDELVDELYATVGWRITRLRRARGLRQDDLATAVGLTRSSIANTETGRQRLPLHALLAVAQALGVDLVDLLDTGREMPVLVQPLPPGAYDTISESLAVVEGASRALERVNAALRPLIQRDAAESRRDRVRQQPDGED